jgi:hypothetical protein
MRATFLAIALAVSSMVAFAQSNIERIDELMSVPQDKAAENSFAAGDKRFILVPNCDDFLGGYPIDASNSQAPIDFDKAKRPAPSCEQLMGKATYEAIIRLRPYANSYNQRMYQLVYPKGHGKQK